MQQPKPQRQSYAARTLQQVEKALKNTSISGSQTKMTGNNYLVCRYDPWSAPSTGAKGVPDGLGRNITTRDLFGAYDIETSAGGDTEILILPALPMQMAIRSQTAGGSVKVDGTTYTRATTNYPAGTWQPIGPSTALAFRNQYNAADTSNFIASGRIVTVGYRLYYTGPASTCEGIVQADVYPIHVDTYGNNIEAKTQIFSTAGAEFAVDLTADTSKSIVLNMATAGNFITQNSVTLRPEAGAHSVLPRKVTSAAHLFKPYHEIGLVPIDNTWAPSLDDPASRIGALFQGDYTLTPAGTGSMDKTKPSFPIVSFWDSDFDAIRIRIQGTSLKFRLEIITCIQFQHNNNFSLISLTKGPEEKNQAVLDKDDKIAPHVSPALPLSVSMVNNSSPRRRPRRSANNSRPNPSRNNKRNRRARRSANGTKTVSLKVNGTTTVRPN